MSEDPPAEMVDLRASRFLQKSNMVGTRVFVEVLNKLKDVKPKWAWFFIPC